MYHIAVSAMNSRLDILLLDMSEGRAVQVGAEIEAEVAFLQTALNRFSPDSDINKLCRNAQSEAVQLNNFWLELFTKCRDACKQTNGLFDITCGFPDGWFVDDETNKLSITDHRVRFDFGGCAKGYLLDWIHVLLKRESVERAFLNFGDSSMLALGTHPAGDCWPVTIANPYPPQQLLETMQLTDCAMSVSGNMPTHERHIIDPRTGFYCDIRRLTVAVSQNAFQCEVLSTALMIASGEEAEQIAQRFNIKKYTIYNT